MRKYILFLFFLTSFLYSYGQKIEGVITDTNGEKLIGINISIENKGTGSTSDNNGSYSLEIPAEKSIVLIYSAIGYEMQKIRIPPLKQQESYTLNITLIEKNNLLNDKLQFINLPNNINEILLDSESELVGIRDLYFENNYH